MILEENDTYVIPINFTLNYICPTNKTMVVLQKEQVSIGNDCQVAWLTIQVCPSCKTYHYFFCE